MKIERERRFIDGKSYGYKIGSLIFWLLLWEIGSRAIDNQILLVSPAEVFFTLVELIQKLNFWKTIGFSSLRIIIGFFLALIVGVILGILSYRSRLIAELIVPLMKVIKATPVASFIILALIWIRARNLSVLISFLMVLPIVFTNIRLGLKRADEKLLQMAKVFKIGVYKKILAIYIPTVAPYFFSAISVGLGFCWKSGIAAEVIGIPVGSIGERLYEAKLYLMTKELFAWSVVIILISTVFEKIVKRLLKAVPYYHANNGPSFGEE